MMRLLDRTFHQAPCFTTARKANAFPLALRSSAFVFFTLIFTLGPTPASAHGDVHEQIEEMGRKLAVNPADSEARTTRASAYFAHGQYPEALADLDLLPAPAANQSGPALLRIRACLKVFRLNDADALLASFLAAHPGDRYALRERANLRLAQERFADAIADIDLLIAATPEADPDLLLDRARATARLDPEKALAWIDARLGTTPLLVLQEEAVTICQNRKRPKDAAERLAKMAVQTPRPEFCHARRAKLLAEAGFASESRQAWQECLASLEKLPPHTRSQPAVQALYQATEAALAPTPSP